MKRLSWKKSEVSPDGTHHVIDGAPMYDARFLKALSFHEPGLAAVCHERGAWHIDVLGNPAYSQTFDRTFGFYENLAAVENTSGYFHIAPDGAPAYRDIYRWCGNFQGGRAVVYSDNGYAHILLDGNRLYSTHFLYAGDFRERRASVRLFETELCTHIDERGAFAHPFRYREAGVYHKGFACAKDKHGWMHIDMEGVPIYQQRFASLEPFYNGRALAETFDGNIVTIDEQGRNASTISRLPTAAGEKS